MVKPERNDIKSHASAQLRAYANGESQDFALAGIYGLGELGGVEAFRHIEELMDDAHRDDSTKGRERWAALLRAYGRAARHLPN